MWTILFSKVGGYIVGGVLVAALLGGGWWYIGHLRNQNDLLTRQVKGYRQAMQIIKNDLKQDQEDQDEKDRIDALTPEQLPTEFDKLRQRARDLNTHPPDADN